MGAEKFITGKVDDSRHEGRAAERRRLQETDQQLHDFYEGVDVIPRNQQNHQDNLNRLHGYYYKGTYYHQGVGQKSKE